MTMPIKFPDFATLAPCLHTQMKVYGNRQPPVVATATDVAAAVFAGATVDPRVLEKLVEPSVRLTGHHPQESVALWAFQIAGALADCRERH